MSADRFGFVKAKDGGYYFNQTRFVSRFELCSQRKRVKSVSCVAVEPHAMVAYYLLPSPAGAKAGPPGDEDSSGGEIVAKGIEIQINTYVGGGYHQDAQVTNHALKDTTVALDWVLAADFADLDEVSSGSRKQDAPVRRCFSIPAQGRAELTLAYQHPKLNHATRIGMCAPGLLEDFGTSLRTTFQLRRGEAALIQIDIAPVFLGKLVEPWFGLDGEPTAHYVASAMRREWLSKCTDLVTPNATIQAAWARAATDLWSLQSLSGVGDENFTPIAGIPHYAGLFGRDSLVAGIQSSLLNPSTLRGALLSVGKWTATAVNDDYDAEPGKVLHQRQLSPLAILGETPFKHYYGDYSAPAYYLMGAAAHFKQTGDKRAFDEIRDKVTATLTWMDRYGDIDGDGFYEYRTLAGNKGLKNQGWKDSSQAILYPDGSYVRDPIAVAEVQGLFFAAKRSVAEVFLAIGETDRASQLLEEAADLKERFNDRFWMPDLGFYALALDPEKRPVRTIASNVGLCLACGIVDDDKSDAVARRLMAADMFSGWGVRTLSSDHPAFNPLAYHLGSIWPVSNAHLSVGLKRYGFIEQLHIVAGALFDATRLFEEDRLPEVFGGNARTPRHRHPGIYPNACSPQAWSASAVIQICHALTGIIPLAPLSAVIIDPALPAWMPEVTIRNLAVGEQRVSIALHRDSNGETHHEIVEGGAGLRVCRPNSAAPGQDRFASASYVAIARDAEVPV
jgi:glycogen debranching enzyme